MVNELTDELTIEQRLIIELKAADCKWRNEGILTMHLKKGELTAGLEALKSMADNNIISFRITRVGAINIKEYRYHESVRAKLNRGKFRIVE